MSDPAKERILLVLAILLCVAVSLLGVLGSPDIAPMGIIYPETTTTVTTAAASDNSSIIDDQVDTVTTASMDSMNVNTYSNSESRTTNQYAATSETVKNTSAETTRKTVFAGKTNINTASKEQLMKLDGIGETLAQRVIDYRQTHGGFSAIEEIMNVNGIGEKRYAVIRDHITVS